MRESFHKFAKCVLILAFFYQLVIIILFANGSSVLGRRVGAYFVPYANAIGLNTAWNFFSPDPAHTMYIRYEVYFEDKEGNDLKEPITAYFPKEKNKLAESTTSRRYLYAMRYYMIQPKKIEFFLAPWLCRQYLGASHIRVQYEIESIPNLDEASIYAQTVSVDDMIEKIKYLNIKHDCRKPLDEVGL